VNQKAAYLRGMRPPLSRNLAALSLINQSSRGRNLFHFPASITSKEGSGTPARGPGWRGERCPCLWRHPSGCEAQPKVERWDLRRRAL